LPEIQNIRVSTPGQTLHTVKSAETLWRISKMYGVDLDELVKANSLKDKSSVESGRVLIIPSSRSVAQNQAPETKIALVPAKNYAARSSNIYTRGTFTWPMRGQILSTFGAKVDNARNKGIDIQAYDGKDVRASRSGTVVFCDDQLKGFGKTVIIDHGDNYQTVYAYNSAILVRVGDTIQQNAIIAKAGRTGRAKEPSLHFEIRKDGEPRDPFYYLPK
jgi:septal ring factor EnvC (AmiA/AmiB activator)